MTAAPKPWWEHLLEALAGFWTDAQLARAGAGPEALRGTVTTLQDLPTFGEDQDDLEARQRAGIVAFARSQKGKPYRLGAEVAPGKGAEAPDWDCSELVEASYRDGGRLPMVDGCVNQQAYMQKVKTWKAGDCLFLEPNAKGTRHVLIYSGEDTFIHAAGGRGVVEDPAEMWLSNQRAAGPYRHVDFSRSPEDRA